MRLRRFLSCVICAFLPLPAVAEEALVAVAANFLTTAESLAARYEAESGHRIVVTHGATGQLYAQILNGAPYDIFLSADERRPALLDEQDRASERRTYALGQLSLISKAELDLSGASSAFEGKTVALADPTVAPYGLASTSAMEDLRLDTSTFRTVLLSDVGQVASVFATGNADFAFVAKSLLPVINPPFATDMSGRHPPIRQDGVLLLRAADNEAATGFWTFLKGDAAQDLIEDAGYGLPE